MVKVAYQSCVCHRHHPNVGFPYSFSVFVFGFHKYFVVRFVACYISILLDGLSKYLVEIFKEALRLAKKSVGGSFVHIKILSTGIA